MWTPVEWSVADGKRPGTNSLCARLRKQVMHVRNAEQRCFPQLFVAVGAPTFASVAVATGQAYYSKTWSEAAGEPFDHQLTKSESSKRIDELQVKTGRGIGI